MEELPFKQDGLRWELFSWEKYSSKPAASPKKRFFAPSTLDCELDHNSSDCRLAVYVTMKSCDLSLWEQKTDMDRIILCNLHFFNYGRRGAGWGTSHLHVKARSDLNLSMSQQISVIIFISFSTRRLIYSEILEKVMTFYRPSLKWILVFRWSRQHLLHISELFFTFSM